MKASLDAAAEDAEQSANAWAMRCLERCANMDEIGEKLGEIWQTARSATANDADAFSKETLLEMLSHIDDVGGKDCCSSWLGRKGARKSAHRCWLPCGYGRARPYHRRKCSPIIFRQQLGRPLSAVLSKGITPLRRCLRSPAGSSPPLPRSRRYAGRRRVFRAHHRASCGGNLTSYSA